jgi:hypothetical protein
MPALVALLRRIGILVPSAYGAGMIAPFSMRLAGLGWAEGRNLSIEVRRADLPRCSLADGVELQRWPYFARRFSTSRAKKLAP